MRGGDLQLATGEHRKQVGEPGRWEEEERDMGPRTVELIPLAVLGTDQPLRN